MAVTTFAAIDVGSNELTMKIFEISKKNGIHELTCVRHTTELGTDTYTNGRISDEMVSEVCRVLLGFTDIMKEFGAIEYNAYATSALREASNNITVLDRIKLRSGLKIKIISNSEQRFLRYKAIALKKDAFNTLIRQGSAIVDVGGGSTQISIFNEESLLSTQNIPLGSLRIKELLRYIEKQADNYKDLLEEYIDCDIKIFHNNFLALKNLENMIAVGEQLYEFKRYASFQGKGDSLSISDFEEIYNYLLSLTTQEISHKLDISPEQSSLLLPTAMIYHKVMKRTGTKNIWLCDINLCDGIAAEYAEKKEKLIPSHNFTNDIIQSARQIGERYQSDTVHTGNVEYLALNIFDSIRTLHGLGKRERLLLQIAVILHDSGSYINMKDVQENSYKIIMTTEIIGLSHIEREIVANLVRFSSNDFPEYVQMSHIFNTENYVKIAKLTAILRIANAMDKSRNQKCKNIKITHKENQLILIADTTKDITLEMGIFYKKAEFFEQVYGIQPILRQKRRNQYGK